MIKNEEWRMNSIEEGMDFFKKLWEKIHYKREEVLSSCIENYKL